jgi:hypothetical protein
MGDNGSVAVVRGWTPGRPKRLARWGADFNAALMPSYYARFYKDFNKK